MPFSKRSDHDEGRPSHLRLVRGPATAGTGSSARDRIEIVPLSGSEAEPTATVLPVAPPRPLAPVAHDRRSTGPQADGDAGNRLRCTACGRKARVDIVDLRTRRVHLSCDRCYRMWQEQIRADDPAHLTRRR